MRSQPRLRILLPTVVLALAGVGVGAFAFSGTPPLGGDDPLPPPPGSGTSTTTNEPASTSAPAPKAWAAQASKLCRDTLKQVDALEEPETAEELQTTLKTSHVLGTQLLRGLATLPRPASGPDRSDIARLLAYGKRSNAALTDALDALATKDVETFGDRMDESHAFGESFDAVAVRLGAGDCAVDSTKRLSPLERALLRHRIVVVVLYAPDAPLDALAVREARVGADKADVGFVAVRVANNEDARTIAKQFSVRKPPAVVVMRRWVGAVKVFTGYVDRATVAQAAANAKV